MSSPAAAKHGGRNRQFILAVTVSCSCSISNKQTRVAISIFWREPRLSLNPKFTDSLVGALVLRTRSSRACSDRKHEYPRESKAAYQIQKTGIERPCLRNQITHDQRPHETSKISDRVDQADRSRRRRLTEKFSRHGPEGWMV